MIAKKFSQLIDKMPAPAVKRPKAKAQAMLAEMPLYELRQARGLSQKMLADVLHVQLPSIAKIEKRVDMYIPTLRSQIEAMGGELEVVARFPDVNVKISNFSDISGPLIARDVHCAMKSAYKIGGMPMLKKRSMVVEYKA